VWVAVEVRIVEIRWNTRDGLAAYGHTKTLREVGRGSGI